MTGRDLPPGMISLGDAAAKVVQTLASDDVYGEVEFAAGSLSFSAWLDLVEAEVKRITSLPGGVGLSREDFADWAYAEAFEDGLEPDQAARDMLAADVTGAGFLELAGIDGDF